MQLHHVCLKELENNEDFIQRHIGPNEQQRADMLKLLQINSLDELITSTVPANILREQPMALAEPLSEEVALSQLKVVASENKPMRSFIGMGYYNTFTPNVVQRNVLENPGWYTAYTPYQPEIAQGRLESLLNYQQMCIDLTGLELASASLLDEGTAAAEAMALAKRVSKNKKAQYDYTIQKMTEDILEEDTPKEESKEKK